MISLKLLSILSHHRTNQFNQQLISLRKWLSNDILSDHTPAAVIPSLILLVASDYIYRMSCSWNTSVSYIQTPKVDHHRPPTLPISSLVFNRESVALSSYYMDTKPILTEIIIHLFYIPIYLSWSLL